MSHKRLFVAATIIACIIIAGFVLSVPHTRDTPAELAAPTASERVPEVALHDVYRKGVHTITGSLTVPNACVTVSASASPASDGSTIVVAVTTTDDGDVCLQRSHTVRFSTTVTAPANVPITASVNGIAATTTAL
ncbi:MAG: hypothetical protein WCT45_02160 [Candidatus Paceibacterota bacterium]|jgi:hypothetical protein